MRRSGNSAALPEAPRGIRHPSAFPRRETGRALTLLIALILLLAGMVGWWWLNPAQAPHWAREQMPWLFVTETVVYRWQDERGQWHVSDQPPADRPYEVVHYRSDTNVMPPDPGS